MEFEYQGESIVEERLVWHEAEEARLRDLAASYLRQAEEHAAKAAAFRLVVEDIDLALSKFWGWGKQAPTVQEEGRLEPSPAVDTFIPESPIQEVTAVNPKPDARPFIDWVREAVKQQADRFDLVSVRQTLESIAPGLLDSTTDRTALSKALSRMAETKEIHVQRKGQGKRPAIYRQKWATVTTADIFDDDEADEDRPKEEVNDNSGQVSDRVPTSG